LPQTAAYNRPVISGSPVVRSNADAASRTASFTLKGLGIELCSLVVSAMQGVRETRETRETRKTQTDGRTAGSGKILGMDTTRPSGYRPRAPRTSNRARAL